LVITLAFICLNFVATAQAAEGDTALSRLQALHCIYGLHFGDFQKSLSLLNEKEKNAKALLEIFALRWREVPVAFSASNKKYEELLLKNLTTLENEKEPHLLTGYFKICTFLFLAEYHSLLDENWAALKYAQKAYPLIIESIDKNINLPEFQFVKGLYLYYIEFYKQKNFFYRAALSPLRSGSRQKGIAFLKASAEQPSIAQVEARIYYSHILMHLENRPWEALAVSRQLATDFPENLKFTELYADNLIRCKLYKEAISMVDRLQNQKKEYYSIPGHFFRGVIEEEYFKNTVKAKQEYEYCVEKNYTPSEVYKRLASQRLKKM